MMKIVILGNAPRSGVMIASKATSNDLHEKSKEELLDELTRIRAERDAYLEALHALMRLELEQIPWDKDELLSHVGKQKPLREFIEELKQS